MVKRRIRRRRRRRRGRGRIGKIGVEEEGPGIDGGSDAPQLVDFRAVLADNGPKKGVDGECEAEVEVDDERGVRGQAERQGRRSICHTMKERRNLCKNHIQSSRIRGGSHGNNYFEPFSVLFTIEKENMSRNSLHK